MQRTSNYQLPKWETNDRIRMEDFNDMTGKIDAGIEAAKSFKNYAVGSYHGTYNAQTVVVGFRPKAVLISKRLVTYDSNSANGVTALFLDDGVNTLVTILDNGFRVPSTRDVSDFPSVNDSHYDYDYIAFR